MRNIFLLTKLEIKKIWKLKSSKINLLLIIFFSFAYFFLSEGVKGVMSSQEDKSLTWEQQIEENMSLLEEYKDDESMAILGTESIDAQKAIHQYRLDNNLAPSNSIWDYSINICTSLFKVILILIIILSINTITNEYEHGTIKQLLIKPYKRWKILLSKFVAVIMYSIFMLITLLLISLLIGGIYIHNKDIGSMHIGFLNGSVFAIKSYMYELIALFLLIINIIVVVAFCFAIALIINSKSISLIVSLLCIISGNTITKFLIGKLDFVKYTFLPNMDLLEHFNYGSTSGLSLQLSLIILFISIVIFGAIAMKIFCEKNIYK